MDINFHVLGKRLGATLADDRPALDYYYGHMQDTDAEVSVRRFARGVVMGAAQVNHPDATDVGAAVRALGLDKPAPPAPLTGDELVLALSRAVDAVREDAHTPVWTPLEAVLPYDWCGGFMFMAAREGRVLAGSPDRRKRKMFFEYKHGVTRRYLIVGDDLQAYTYRSDACEIGDPAYSWTPMENAIEHVFEGIEEFGAERTTKYSAEYIAERNARLVAAGFTVVG